MNNEDNICHCGKPLHYSNDKIKWYIQEIIEHKNSRFVLVKNIETNKQYKVDIHYIALHGIEANKLDQYGFEEVKN